MKTFLFILISFNILVFACVDKSYAEQDAIKVTQQLKKYSIDDVVIEQYKWQGAIPSSGQVKVINPFGSISVKNINQPIVAVTGAMQLIGHSPTKAKIITKQEHGVQIIEVTYPEGNSDVLGQRTGRVDLGIFVPQGVALTLITNFGDIKSRKLKSNVIAKTYSGKIKIGSSATIQAQTHTGDIKLTIQKDNSKNARFVENSKTRFNTVTSTAGNIQVYLQDNVNISLAANSQRGIKSNLLANKYTQITTKTKGLFTAVLGQGTRHYEINSQTGMIYFYRSEWHKMKLTINEATVNEATVNEVTIKVQQVTSP